MAVLKQRGRTSDLQEVPAHLNNGVLMLENQSKPRSIKQQQQQKQKNLKPQNNQNHKITKPNTKTPTYFNESIRKASLYRLNK